jgi:hypothetical protein
MHEFDNETLVGMAILGNADAVKVNTRGACFITRLSSFIFPPLLTITS